MSEIFVILRVSSVFDRRVMMLRKVLVVVLLLVNAVQADDIPEVVRNTQNASDIPPAPNDSAGKMTLPDGFKVSLFAGEPDVAQPVAIATDDRGRLWVAEFYSYLDWKREGNDRIVILEDTDGDGRFDRRKVFWDKGNYLSGLEVEFGGVWVCCAPHLLFIPDKDGDDVPDGEPIVHLEGWTYSGKHTVLNSLVWGPDGWLYGCNGNANDSAVGIPGSLPKARGKLNCGIWRYHPIRHQFEVVACGTANPWGLDFNDYGEGFFTNCVIGHLWHLIPGAHYKRIYGREHGRHTYEKLDACSDHYHFAGDNWRFSRGDKGKEAPKRSIIVRITSRRVQPGSNDIRIDYLSILKVVMAVRIVSVLDSVENGAKPNCRAIKLSQHSIDSHIV